MIKGMFHNLTTAIPAYEEKHEHEGVSYIRELPQISQALLECERQIARMDDAIRELDDQYKSARAEFVEDLEQLESKRRALHRDAIAAIQVLGIPNLEIKFKRSSDEISTINTTDAEGNQ